MKSKTASSQAGLESKNVYGLAGVHVQDGYPLIPKEAGVNSGLRENSR